MANPQSYAVQIEHTMRRAFDCDRSGVGGFVNSDYIRKHPFMALMCTLTFLCKNDDTHDVDIVSDFFEKFQYYGDWSIDQLLSFENNSAVISGSTYEIDYANGEEAIRAIINCFDKACDQLKFSLPNSQMDGYMS